MLKFDIIKINPDTKNQEREFGVNASSANELISLYAMCGEEVQIIKQYEDEDAPAIEKFQDTGAAVVKNQHNLTDTMQSCAEKCYKIGDQEFKVVGDQLFKRDWLDYDPDEDVSIRVVSDKTGKSISMTGKKIQTLEWIKVDE